MGALGDQLSEDVRKVFTSPWTERDGKKVPEPEEVLLGNDCVKLQGIVLYADLAESTNLVDSQAPHFAASIYKSYLDCAAKIIRARGGVITSYDGDRIMGVFHGNNPNTNAVKAGLQIHHAVRNIINPRLKQMNPSKPFVVRHGVGIDTCLLHVANTGIRGSHDLVWVGSAANYAAKLCGIREEGYATYITKAVYDSMLDPAKMINGKNMWEARTWKGRSVYRSQFWWPI